jgi:hypothetical protein
MTLIFLLALLVIAYAAAAYRHAERAVERLTRPRHPRGRTE